MQRDNTKIYRIRIWQILKHFMIEECSNYKMIRNNWQKPTAAKQNKSLN